MHIHTYIYTSIRVEVDEPKEFMRRTHQFFGHIVRRTGENLVKILQIDLKMIFQIRVYFEIIEFNFILLPQFDIYIYMGVCVYIFM